VEALFMQGCPVSNLSGSGFTPLHAAAGFGDIATVRVLLNMKVDINAASVSTLIYFNQLLHNHAGADA
jgi:ankyrin repeat protein